MGLLDSLFNTQAPDYSNGLLGDTADLQRRANTTGLVNMALGYLAAPKNQNLGLGRILAGSYVAGQQGAQGTYDNALNDWQTKQKILDLQSARAKSDKLDAYMQSYGKPNSAINNVENVPAPQGIDAPNFGTMQQTTSTPTFNNSEWQKGLIPMLDPVQALSVMKAGNTDSAHEAFDAKFPQYAGLSRLNPSMAMKVAYPNLSSNSVDPYFTPIATDKGFLSFDQRTGKAIPIDVNGVPVVKSTDSPFVRGAVKDAESHASALWKPNTDINGVVSTDAQVSQAANGVPAYQGNTPYQMTWNGSPMGAPNTTRTDAIEGDGNVQVRDPANPKRMSSLGIKVPTKEEQAAATYTSEANAKRTQNMTGLGGIIDEAKTILNGNIKPTSSGFGKIADATGAMFGIAPEGAAQADKLKALGGALVAKMPRMEGPQSDKDVENYRLMAGNIADDSLPIARRIEALKTVESLWRKYDVNSTSQATTEQSKPQAYSTLPKTAPKGQIIRNPSTGARKQFNGLTWVDIK